jgi:hypothetical protein
MTSEPSLDTVGVAGTAGLMTIVPNSGLITMLWMGICIAAQARIPRISSACLNLSRLGFLFFEPFGRPFGLLQ